MATPPTLLAGLRERNPDALRRVAEENASRLFRAARGMGLTAEEADDLVQDVFVTFLGTLDRFEGRASVSTWLYGILLRKVQERRRVRVKEARHDPVDEAWSEHFDGRGNWLRKPAPPDRALSSREMSRAIAECLEDLTPLQRQVFVLRLVEELPAAEVSKMVDATVTHIGVLLHRARLRIRACLDGRGWRMTRS